MTYEWNFEESIELFENKNASWNDQKIRFEELIQMLKNN